MSVAFLFTLPVAIGAVSVALTPPERRGSTWYLLGVPWISSILMVAVAVAFLHEAIICVVMALPLLLPLVTVGAVTAFLVTHTVGQQWSQRSPLLLVALVPYLVAPIEAQIAAPDSEHVVHNSVIVYAPPEVVWQQIIRVPAIKPVEQSFSPLHLLGLPKPVEATLSYEGVGAVRHASFERDLLFVETVNEWRDQQSIGFSIKRDEDSHTARAARRDRWPVLRYAGRPLRDPADRRWSHDPAPHEHPPPGDALQLVRRPLDRADHVRATALHPGDREGASRSEGVGVGCWVSGARRAQWLRPSHRQAVYGVHSGGFCSRVRANLSS